MLFQKPLHPLSAFRFQTPSNESNSTSEQATTSTTSNQQVAADNGGIAIGAGASYSNSFSPEVEKAVSEVIDKAFNFAGNTVLGAGQLASTSQASAAAAVAAAQQVANQATNNAQLGQSSLFTNPAVITGIVATLAIFAYLITKRR